MADHPKHIVDEYGDTLDIEWVPGERIQLEFANSRNGDTFELILHPGTAEELRDHLTELLDNPPVNDPD